MQRFSWYITKNTASCCCGHPCIFWR